jgi:flagellar biosynthesis protein FlhF
MNVKRFTGKTTRDAMSLLREELGSEALILANRPCAEGVEILATTADAPGKLTLGATLQSTSPREAPGFVFAAATAPNHRGRH